MTEVARMHIEIGARLTRLETDLKRANRIASRNAKQLERAFSSAARAIKVTVGAAAVGAVTVLGKRAVDTADKVGKLSQRLGLTTNALSELQFVAERSGVRVEQLNMGLQRMTRRVAEAAQGTGEAKAAIKELGLDAQKLAQMSPDQQFEAIAEALSGVASQSDKVRLAFKLFDSEGVGLLQTMGDGAEGIRKLREEARRLGASIGPEMTQNAAQFNDMVSNLRAQMFGLAQRVAADVLPRVNEFLSALQNSNVLRVFGDAVAFVVANLDKFALVAGSIVAANVLVAIASGLQAATASMVTFKAAVVGVLGPVGWVAAGAAALSVVLLELAETNNSFATTSNNAYTALRQLNDQIERGNLLTAEQRMGELADELRELEGELLRTSKALQTYLSGPEHQQSQRVTETLTNAVEEQALALRNANALYQDAKKRITEKKTAEATAVQTTGEFAAVTDELTRALDALIQTHDKLGAEAKRHESAVQTLAEARQAEMLSMDRYVTLLQAEVDLHKKHVVALDGTADEHKRLREEQEKAQRVAKENARAWDALKVELGLVTQAEARLAEIQALLNRLLAEGVIGVVQYEHALELARQKIDEFSDATERTGGALGDVWGGIASEISQGFDRMIDDLIDGNLDFEKSFEDMAKNMAKTWLKTMLKNSDAYKKFLKDAQNMQGGAFAGGMVGFGIGSAVGQGHSDIGGAIGGAIGSIWGPIGSMVGSLLGSFVGSLFGGADGPPQVSVFGTIGPRDPGGAGGSPDFARSGAFGDVSVRTQNVVDEMREQIQPFVDAIVEFDNQLAHALGLSEGQIAEIEQALESAVIRVGGVDQAALRDALEQRFDIILGTFGQGIANAVRDLGGDLETQTQNLADALALQDVFDRAFFDDIFETDGNFDEFIEHLAEFNRTGESLSQTYQRLAQTVAGLETAFDLLGHEFAGTREEFVSFAESLADQAGGVDRLNSLWNAYFKNFYTQEELLERQISQLREIAALELADIGLAADTSLEEFRRLFEAALPTLTEEQIVQWLEAAEALGFLNEALAALGGNAEEVVDAVEDTTEQLAEFMRGTQDSIDDLTLTDFELAIKEIDRWLAEATATALELGASQEELALIQQLAALRVEEAVANLESAIRGLITDIGLTDGGEDITGKRSALQEQIRSIDAEIRTLLNTEQQRINEINRLQQQRYQAELAAIKSVQGVADSLVLNTALTPLTPGEQLSEARGQFDALFRQAIGPGGKVRDVEALRKLPEAGRQFLEIARGFFASGEDYRAIFESVTSRLTTAENAQANLPTTATFSPEVSAQITALESLKAQLVAQLENLIEQGPTEEQQATAVELLERLVEWADHFPDMDIWDALTHFDIPLSALLDALGIDLASLPGLQDLITFSETIGVTLAELVEQMGGFGEVMSQLANGLDPETLIGALELLFSSLDISHVEDALSALAASLQPGDLENVLEQLALVFNPGPLRNAIVAFLTEFREAAGKFVTIVDGQVPFNPNLPQEPSPIDPTTPFLPPANVSSNAGSYEVLAERIDRLADRFESSLQDHKRATVRSNQDVADSVRAAGGSVGRF